MKPHSGWRQLLRFCLVGAANSAFGLGVIYACRYALHFSDIAANATGYACGLALSFALNSRWTFAANDRDARNALPRFAAAFLASYAANLGVLLGWMHAMPDRAAFGHALGIVAYTALFFALSKRWVFAKRPASVAPPERTSSSR